MNWRKRIETNIEIREFFIIHKTHQPTMYCDKCLPIKSEMVTAEEAAELAGVDRRSIYRWVELDLVHFVERPNGVLVVCLNALP